METVIVIFFIVISMMMAIFDFIMAYLVERILDDIIEQLEKEHEFAGKLEEENEFLRKELEKCKKN